jgi:hypothetical protein
LLLCHGSADVVHNLDANLREGQGTEVRKSPRPSRNDGHHIAHGMGTINATFRSEWHTHLHILPRQAS